MEKVKKPFGTFDFVKSEVEIELKTASTIKQKDRWVKKLKARFGEGATEAEEEEEEEEEHGQAPLKLTQGLGKDVEGSMEAPKGKEKKRKAKTQKREKPEKNVKKSQQKPLVPITRSSTREAIM